MAQNHDMKLFVPITKVDAKKRLVYGIITQEVVDKAGEMFDYASGKPEIEKWSNEMSEATGGKSKGNLRAMHTHIAAGKFTDFHFDDENKAVYASAKVVDDDEWKKVEEGVYSGFSIGGGYKKRWVDETNPQIMRFTPTIAEVSLVDNPCVPTATFEYIKADGGHEIRKFHHKPNEDNMTVKKDNPSTTATSEDVVEKTETAAASQEPVEKATDAGDKPATEGKEAADAPKVVKVIDGKRVLPENDPVNKWVAIDGSLHDKKDEARDRNLEIEAAKKLDPANELMKKIDAALTKAEGKDSEEDNEELDNEGKKKTPKKSKKADDSAADDDASGDDADKKADKSVDSTITKDGAKTDKPELKKGLYEVGTFANILQNICWLQSGAESEAKREGDNSPLPEALKAWLKTGADILKAYVEEEVSELFPEELPEVEVLAMAAKMSGDTCDALAKHVKPEGVKAALSKAGSRHSKADKESLLTIHKAATDHLAGIEKCFKEVGVMDDDSKEDDAKKSAASGNNESLLKTELESERKQRAGLEKHIDTLSGQLQKVLQRIESLEKQPMPPKGIVRTVSKGQDVSSADGGEGVTPEHVQEIVNKMTPEQRALLIMKMSLNQGQVLAK